VWNCRFTLRVMGQKVLPAPGKVHSCRGNDHGRGRDAGLRPPSTPEAEPHKPHAMGSLCLGLVANYAYLFTSTSELVIVDIGNPVNPIVVRTISFGSLGLGSGFTTNGRYGYLVGGNFRVLDLQDFSSPVLVVDLDVAFEGRDISVSGNLACIALVNNRSLSIGGMIVMDVQTPGNPQQLSGYSANVKGSVPLI
jgi:hypothetical protein